MEPLSRFSTWSSTSSSLNTEASSQLWGNFRRRVQGSKEKAFGGPDFMQAVSRKLHKHGEPTSPTHLARSFADQPLTLDGVKNLQNDTRLNRSGAAKKAALVTAATLLPTALAGVVAAAIFAPALVPVAPVALGCAVGVSAAVAARKGQVLAANSKLVRKHGFYYTAIVGSKKESAAICAQLEAAGVLASDRALPETLDVAAVRTALTDRALALDAAQVRKVTQYLQLAHDNLT